MGMAVISFDFSSVTSWPNTHRFEALHALTLCNGFLWFFRSRDPRAVLPSTLINSASVCVYTLCAQLMKHSWKPLGDNLDKMFYGRLRKHFYAVCSNYLIFIP
jgi:hypothetical protein